MERDGCKSWKFVPVQFISDSVLETIILHKKHYQRHKLLCGTIISRTRRTTYKTSPCKDTRNTYDVLYSAEIYSWIRSRNLINMLFNFGLCISYERVLEICKNIYENLRESYENNKFFFLNILKMGLFTVMLKDNIDLNSKSNFVQLHYQGTSRSMI